MKKRKINDEKKNKNYNFGENFFLRRREERINCKKNVKIKEIIKG